MRALVLAPLSLSILALTGCIIYTDGGWEDCDCDCHECSDEECWDDEDPEDWVDEDGDGIPDDQEDPDDDPESDCTRAYEMMLFHETEAAGWLEGQWWAGPHGEGWMAGEWAMDDEGQYALTGTWGSAEGEYEGQLEGRLTQSADGDPIIVGWATTDDSLAYFQGPIFEEEPEVMATSSGWWSFSELQLEGMADDGGAWHADGFYGDAPVVADGDWTSDGWLSGHLESQLLAAPVEGAWYEWEQGVSWGWDAQVGEWGWLFGAIHASDEGDKTLTADGFPWGC